MIRPTALAHALGLEIPEGFASLRDEHARILEDLQRARRAAERVDLEPFRRPWPIVSPAVFERLQRLFARLTWKEPAPAPSPGNRRERRRAAALARRARRRGTLLG